MNICTFNVNSIRARRDLILQWLDSRGQDLDVLLFQELKGEEGHFPFADFEALGYECAVYGQKTYNGVAVCSKIPMSDIRLGFGDAPWDEQKRLMAVRIGELHIINVYVPHGDIPETEKFRYKQDWYQTFLQTLSTRYSSKDQIIIGGDFNVTRGDMDVYAAADLAGAVGTLKEEREVFESLLQWGLTDVFRFLHPKDRTFTWWDYRTAGIWRDEGMRIDYLLCTFPLVKRFKHIAVDLWPRKRRFPTPSDHAPLWAIVD
ncbi:MAG: exodeoxyribonuclease III [Acidobacteria bacterium]|nr:exodeoxyribonuclease III [Acidobacteriota bacterium]MBU4328876.1 exodeoxyribonuclease III [Acidobacteriota bacterium]